MLTPTLLALLALAPLNLFVAPTGRDTNAGTKAAPFATIERARDAIRAAKPADGAEVTVAAGTYELARPLAFTAQDSGTAAAPIVYRGARGTRLLGGKRLGGWRPVTDAAVLGRLDPAARAKVVVADLKAAGVTDLAAPGGSPGMELFFGGRAMTLARYPNEGFLKIVSADGPTKTERQGSKEGIFTTDSDRLERWSAEKGLMAHGYWYWDWADARQAVASIDVAAKRITLAEPWHNYGYRKGQWFYVFNALCELDQPGEWYVDRANSLLYFWPPTDPAAAAAAAAGEAMVTVQQNLVTAEGLKQVSFEDLTFEGSRGHGLVLNNCDDVTVSGCTIRNLGSWAVSANGGHRVKVLGCDITATGDGGVSLNGGDRATLTRGDHLVDNCHIWAYSRWNRMYKPAVQLNGVGNKASHCLIHDAPHMAIGFGGNDQTIEFCEIHSVCYESNDAGAIYTGRNWSMRGNVVRNTYLHHIYGHEGRGCMGIYLDDNFSSCDMIGNLFYQVPRAAFVGGGRDNNIANNVFVDCTPAVAIDARGLGWRAYGKDDLTAKLKEMPYTTPLWSTRYPTLPGMLDDEPMAPKGNLIARNICVGGKWDGCEGKAKPYLKFENNLLDADPQFVDAAKLDFRLKPTSPAFALGFKALPIDQMGLYADPARASWPVVSEPRPKPAKP
ncbi:MAG: right-handed parallel beta-helix repeat-containing protein [Armatimonadetes bacterium]|nr:right-handed parallel beta-helix repeat-containing protein [Armatimonadota bacterium]